MAMITCTYIKTLEIDDKEVQPTGEERLAETQGPHSERPEVIQPDGPVVKAAHSRGGGPWFESREERPAPRIQIVAGGGGRDSRVSF